MSATNHRHTLRRDGYWDVSFHLIFDSSGGVRLTRGTPALSSKERGMAVTAKVPFSLFRVPQLSARIELPDNEAPPAQIDLTAAAAALSEAIGARVELALTDGDGGQ